MKYRVIGVYGSGTISHASRPKSTVIVVSSSDIVYFVFTDILLNSCLYAALRYIHAPSPMLTSIAGTEAFKRWVMRSPKHRQLTISSSRRKANKLKALRNAEA
ncbi:hypothetical protein PUW24_10395 [Paenibacillus urinalis]|uniref:Uncharacterized protein n=1 Tax=Paenibacillus urinalis TaxID=521520 RepID=A0AAX3N0L9_9BACL|nr:MULTISPECIES: hypothetical protein [Paenibacillus]WDH83173.1 hypothetical protein PUW23_02685 [Paenibacillus urinalis]WDH99254.1 hypothetical protein PUW24_10395 [Paenibacillus urinalis]WDI02947.1 hypothetical protein PUW25_02845 [Paenibacillus urinalis]GAK40449.1 hypothetical protein TCA2_2939 [Paenibacillus sp. TCA20]